MYIVSTSVINCQNLLQLYNHHSLHHGVGDRANRSEPCTIFIGFFYYFVVVAAYCTRTVLFFPASTIWYTHVQSVKIKVNNHTYAAFLL